MPPPMPNPAKRMTANPARPAARYRPGKAVVEHESSDEEEEGSEKEEKTRQTRRIPQSRPQPARSQAVSRREEDDDDDDEDGFITDPEDEDNGGVQFPANTSDAALLVSAKLSQPKGSPKLDEPSTEEAEAKTESEESEDDDEEEESSSSEEEQPQRKFQRPTFIKKSERKDLLRADEKANDATTSSVAEPEIDEQTRRLAQAELMIKDKLERDALARAQGKKAWDDDEVVAPEDTVDDTDGLDPEAEHQAWKLRELKRLKRDREAIEEREKEIEELERRRNLTTEERAKEDQDYLEKQREEREEGRGKANYLARYHHKGAFFQDDEAAEILKKRDIMGARFQDDVTDKSLLPEYMRVRDMTKLGKKGRTRYTDLKGEDTGRFGDEVKRWRGSGDNRGDGGGPHVNGVDERFLPDREAGGRTGPTGANASAVGQRKERRSRSRSPTQRRAERDRGDSYRPGGRSYSTSRSPPRRKRSPSPYRDRDKRRKVDAV